MSTALLETRDLGVDLSGRTIVNNVHVQVVPGELVGLVGPNGAGKSTLVRLLEGLQRPTRGSILLQGQPIHRIPRRERSRLIGYVPQDTRIDFPLSVEQVVLLGRHAHRSGLVVDSAHDYALAAALERVGLLHLRDRAVSSLSGGERQLVMLARAICGEPKLLLLDEPVSALDLRHPLHALAITRDVIGDGAGGIAVLHDLNLAARFCDRILVMQGGMVRAEGEPSMVLAPSLLRDAYGVGEPFAPMTLSIAQASSLSAMSIRAGSRWRGRVPPSSVSLQHSSATVAWMSRSSHPPNPNQAGSLPILASKSLHPRPGPVPTTMASKRSL